MAMQNLLLVLTYVAVFASSISGALEARKNEMDVVGAVSIAFINAFGGGTLRDMLLGRAPVFWLSDPYLTVATFIAALLAFYKVDNLSESLLAAPDAIGLGIFSILGATYALQLNLSPIVAVLMGVVTGIFGGVLRDVMSARIPSVFRASTELYATCSFIGTWVFIALTWLRVPSFAASLIGAGVIFFMRLLALRFKMTLPSP